MGGCIDGFVRLDWDGEVVAAVLGEPPVSRGGGGAVLKRLGLTVDPKVLGWLVLPPNGPPARGWTVGVAPKASLFGVPANPPNGLLSGGRVAVVPPDVQDPAKLCDVEAGLNKGASTHGPMIAGSLGGKEPWSPIIGHWRTGGGGGTRQEAPC